MNFKVDISGLRELQSEIKALEPKIKRQTGLILKRGGQLWVDGAKKDAPKDVGFLTGQITSKNVDELKEEVVSGSSYSPYMEWGTKGNYRAIPGTESYAAEFKGRGTGDYYDFLNAILDWVKRKGLSNVTNSYTGKKVGGKAAKENLLVLAEAIAWSILHRGVKPHPFFFKQQPKVKIEVEKNLSVMLNDLKI